MAHAWCDCVALTLFLQTVSLCRYFLIRQRPDHQQLCIKNYVHISVVICNMTVIWSLMARDHTVEGLPSSKMLYLSSCLRWKPFYKLLQVSWPKKSFDSLSGTPTKVALAWIFIGLCIFHLIMFCQWTVQFYLQILDWECPIRLWEYFLCHTVYGRVWDGTLNQEQGWLSRGREGVTTSKATDIWFKEGRKCSSNGRLMEKICKKCS